VRQRKKKGTKKKETALPQAPAEAFVLVFLVGRLLSLDEKIFLTYPLIAK